MKDKIRVTGLSGSLRRGSYNTACLRAAKELEPEGMELEIADISGIPFFNADVEARGIPAAVDEFKKKLGEADAILIATPEYNYSIPPVLKNALDWASRGKYMPLDGKPLAIMSASTGMLGGARAQYHLRQVCVRLNMLPINRPEVFIANADKKFDEEGNLTDEYSRNLISQLLLELYERTIEILDLRNMK